MITLTVPGNPAVPAWTTRGAHATGYRDRLRVALHEAAPEAIGLSCTFLVVADFYCSDYHRRDVDNLVKATFDGITAAGLWLDDRQVHEVRARVFRGQSDPRAEIRIEVVPDPSPRPRTCPQCGQPTLYRRKVYCSQPCRSAAAHTVLICKACGRELRLPRSTAALRSTCSRRCRVALERSEA